MNEIPCFAASLGEWRATRSPSMKISPCSGWWMPPRMFIKVDFPAPLTPTRPTISPACASKETSSSAWTPGNVFEIRDIFRLVAVPFMAACLARSQDVETDHGHQHCALDDDRDKGRDAEQIEGIAEHGDEQQSEHRAKH